MASGWWEAHAAKKQESCTRCTSKIGPAELLFVWCPTEGKKTYFRGACAVKGDSNCAPLSKATLKKFVGLNGDQREKLAEVLASAAAAPAKRAAPVSKEEPSAKRSKGQAGVAAAPKAKAKAKAKGKAEVSLPIRGKFAKAAAKPKGKALPSRGALLAKAKGKAKAKAKVKAKAKAKGQAGPKAKAKAKAQASDGQPKAKAKAQASGGGQAASGVSAKDMASFNSQQATFGSWSNDKLKQLLKANDQSRSGNKAVLVAKCADGAAFGKLPRCPKCYGGKIKFRVPDSDGTLCSLFKVMGGAYGEDKVGEDKEIQLKVRRRYYCTGYFDDDEKQDCDWQADAVKRESWTSI